MLKAIRQSLTTQRGMTMVELLVTTMIFGVVLAVLNSVFFSSNKMYAKTNQRIGIQMNSRQGISIMTTEIRHAGCDPTGVGVVAIVGATSDSIHVRADLDGDGAISTAEPSEDIIYFYDSVNQTISRDPGSGAEVIVPNVTNAAFTYLDGANNLLGPVPLDANLANRVRTVTITMTTTSAEAGDITLSTAIALRNP